MDRFYNSKRQNMTNYLDIFKACRLCGSGGGYKMPIIQKLHGDNVIDVEAQLKQKIRECVSIDVHPDDRMPPLICELCVDKVNDFYEFREMCRDTNARVRASLGLPHQNLTQDINEDCILGVSGPVFHNSNESESKKDSKHKNSKKPGGADKKSLRSSEPVPPILDRSSRRRRTDSPQLGGTAKKLRFSSPSSSSGTPDKKRNSKGSESLAETSRKLREARSSKPIEPKKGNLLQKQKELLTQKAKDQSSSKLKPALKNKQLKEATKPKETRESQRSKASEQKSKKPDSKVKQAEQKKEVTLRKKPTAPVAAITNNYKCEFCSESFAKQPDYKQHIDFMHTPLFTDEKLSCTPCGEWFVSLKDADAHHKWHKTSNTYYSCQRCSTDFKVLMGFVKHFQRRQCLPYEVVPDVKCNVCMGMFATENWMNQHKCPGPPKNMCKKCLSIFQDSSSLKKHEKRCKGIIVPLNPNNPHLLEIRPLSIDIQRCDNLVTRIKTEPGLLTTFKQEPMDFEESPIQIKQEIKQEMEDYNSDYGDYGGMDGAGFSSDGSVSETEGHQAPHLVINPFARKNSTQVESLSIISLRSIFGGKLLGKRTKRRKKKKNPKLEMLASMENTTSRDDAFDGLFENNDDMGTEETPADDGNVAKDLVNNEKDDSVEHYTDNHGSIGEKGDESTDNHGLVGEKDNERIDEHDSVGEKGDETVSENALNEIQTTDDVTVDKTEHIEDKADNVNTMSDTCYTSQTIEGNTNSDLNNELSSIDQTTHDGKIKDDSIQNELSSVDEVSGIESNNEINTKPKSFVDGLSLDPEVEALLMEDEDITTNNTQSQNVVKESTLNHFSLSDTSEYIGNPNNEIHNDFESLPFEEESQKPIDQEETQINLKNQPSEHDIENLIGDAPNPVLNEAENESNTVIQSNEGNGDDNSNVELEGKKSEDVLDLISDSGDDCNILDSPEKLTNPNANQAVDEQDHTDSIEFTESQLAAKDKQAEESLLDGKDNCNNDDSEISQQDEDLLLGKDDQDELLQTAQDDCEQDLEKISDGEFDID